MRVATVAPRPSGPAAMAGIGPYHHASASPLPEPRRPPCRLGDVPSRHVHQRKGTRSGCALLVVGSGRRHRLAILLRHDMQRSWTGALAP